MGTDTRTTTYTVRSEGGTITAPGANDLTSAMRAAQSLAAENEGQTIWVCRNGKPVRSGHAWMCWTSGTVAKVQR